MTPEPLHCVCGCALAAWSMPWPVRSGAAAPWSPAAVHETAPRAHVYALFPLESADPDLVDTDLVDTDLVVDLVERTAS